MSIINAAITAVGGYLPEDKITNADLEKMVDTNNEWIMTRVGIRERRILKDPTKGASFLGVEAVKDLFSRNNIDPATIDGIIVATNTADYHFPTTASIVAFETGCINAFTFDMQAACPSFIYALEAGANYIRSGRYKRIIVLAAEKMTAITDYTDRATCPLFGDGAACVLLEPTEENEGVLDSYFRTDGTGRTNLIMKSGGSASPASHETVDRREHYVYQEGAAVFKQAVKGMSSSCRTIMERNGLSYDDIAWVVPHQANLRIIDAVAREMQVPLDRVMVNIEYRGNTSSATIPLCIWEFEKQLKKGDNLILTSFGAGFTWGAVYVKWAYDPKNLSPHTTDLACHSSLCWERTGKVFYSYPSTLRTMEDKQEVTHRSGFVNIVGNPNVGKSTLMNLLVGERVSIITSKAQTTRHRIMGIVNTPELQIVYSDTPGVLRPNYKLQESMLEFSESALGDADVLLYVTDTVETADKNEFFLERVRGVKCPVLLLINKVDLTTQDKLVELVERWHKELPQAEIIPISALNNFNVQPLKKRIESLIPPSPPYFEKDALTDRPARFFVTEIIREKVLLYYKKEIPYSVEVVVESFKEEDERIHIQALIVVERDSQKGIIIGHRGVALKKVGTMARRDMERFFEKKIFLELFVKVEKDWRNRDKILRAYGYRLD